MVTGRAGVVIVTYNSAGAIGPCLDACHGLEIVVIDNASTDSTEAEVLARPGVRFIRNLTNRGFASAVNQGVAAMDNSLVLLLNPDVRLLTSIDPLIAACQEIDVGIATGQLVDESGQAQRGFTIRRLPTPASLAFEVLGLNRIFPRNPINRRYRYLDFDLTQPADVEQPAGAFILFRRDLWEKLGGFDSGFHPIWFEDVDFCRRSLDLRYRTRYLPQVFATHQGGHSINNLEWSCRELYWYASLLRYACKHFSRCACRELSVVVMIAALLRTLEAIIFKRFRGRSGDIWRTYAGVVRLAAGCAVRGTFPQPSEFGAPGSRQ